MDERAKRIVLARRARFLAATLVGVACAPARPAEDVAARDDLVVPPISGDAATALAIEDDAGVATAPRLDSDGDGVFDEDDACPETAGAPSDDPAENGCPQRPPVVVSVCLSIIIPPHPTFPPRSAQMDANAATLLDQIAALMKSTVQNDVEIIGHTDATEPVRLGQERADAVRRALEKRGVDPKRLHTRNAGANEPIDSNATAEGRHRNRRVETKLVP